ncbi:hypothetical protein BOX15_Mlig023228g1 [Macrostomum lignano]|uniref:Uncharacterized protein n=2 Tax=Macrostomum lignano TaxID=282301 RepID=A0A267EXH8_9PLAT|nr:hypothetical protein BOX15_Mlig023228g1 [Macrostomum lignano]
MLNMKQVSMLSACKILQPLKCFSAFLVCLLLMALLAPAKSDISYSEADKKAFVDVHNKLRGNAKPEAEAMNAVKWSAELECLAIKAAYTCVFEHSAGSEYQNKGENIYEGSNSSPKYVVTKWHNETHHYDHNTGKCKPGKGCGHYTQVMTAAVLEIGCGIKRGCGGSDLVFCVYSHGNGIYKQGPKCSKCPAERPCDTKTGLCTGKAQTSFPDGSVNCLPKKGAGLNLPTSLTWIGLLLHAGLMALSLFPGAFRL